MGPVVEPEPVLLVRRHPPADAVAGLQHGDAHPGGDQLPGGREAGHPGADDHHIGQVPARLPPSRDLLHGPRGHGPLPDLGGLQRQLGGLVLWGGRLLCGQRRLSGVRLPSGQRLSGQRRLGGRQLHGLRRLGGRRLLDGVRLQGGPPLWGGLRLLGGQRLCGLRLPGGVLLWDGCRHGVAPSVATTRRTVHIVLVSAAPAVGTGCRRGSLAGSQG